MDCSPLNSLPPSEIVGLKLPSGDVSFVYILSPIFSFSYTCVRELQKFHLAIWNISNFQT